MAKIRGTTISITPACVANHGAGNRIDYAFELIRDKVLRSLKAYPAATIELTYFINEYNGN